MRPRFVYLTGTVLASLASLRALPQGAVLALTPACPFHAATGFLCPGCGATRATLALLHGNLRAAWHANPFFLALVPAALVFAAVALRRRRVPTIPLPLGASLFAASVLFAVLRNLP